MNPRRAGGWQRSSNGAKWWQTTAQAAADAYLEGDDELLQQTPGLVNCVCDGLHVYVLYASEVRPKGSTPLDDYGGVLCS